MYTERDVDEDIYIYIYIYRCIDIYIDASLHRDAGFATSCATSCCMRWDVASRCSCAALEDEIYHYSY